MESLIGMDPSTVILSIDITQIWIYLLIIGPVLLYVIATAGISLSKAGFNSAWALLLLLPVVQLVSIWVFAIKKWPRINMNNNMTHRKEKDTAQ